MPKKPISKTSLFLRDIPRHVKDQFKSACAAKGETMKTAMVKFMRREIKKANGL